MSDWFDDGTDEYEAEKAAKNRRIVEGAEDQLGNLGDDLAYLTSDDNVFTDRRDSTNEKLKFSNKSADVDQASKITKTMAKGIDSSDKLTSASNVQGFEGGGGAEANRKNLAKALEAEGMTADNKKMMDYDAALVKRDEDLKNIKGDQYKALRMLQNEMSSIVASAEGATGQNISYDEPNWDEIFGDTYDG